MLQVAKAQSAVTVLLVEDDPGVRAVAQRTLVRYGHSVLSAEGGEQALRFAKEHPGQIHLLLTDIMMPGMNGVEVARAVQRFRPGIRVFFMSGYADQELVSQGLLDPATHFLQKPFTPRELGQRVGAILGRTGEG